MPVATARDLTRAFLERWRTLQIGTHGAALAYFTIFSIAPLLVVTIAVTGLVLGERAAASEVITRIEQAVGPEPARLLRDMMAQISSPRSGVIATALGLFTLLLGATGVLVRLQGTLQQIWGVDPRGGITASLRQRAVGLLLILGFGALVFASMAIGATITALHDRLATHLPTVAVLAAPANRIATFTLNTAAFALLFRILPGAATPWRDLWAGGAVTALMFAVGAEAIAWYLGRASTSVFGAASALVVLLLWVYYSAQILLAGAVFTVVWSRRREGSLRAAAPAG